MVDHTNGRDFVVGATGDAIVTRPILQNDDQRFERMAEYLRHTDATVTNLEQVITRDKRWAEPPGTATDMYQYSSIGNTILCRSKPEILDDLAGLGINLISAGNNHSLDFGHPGMLETIDILRERKLTFAGLGRDLHEARSPGYVSTSGGRIGLVHSVSSIPPKGEASEASAALPGRPGVNPLHLKWSYNVTNEQLDQLIDIAAEVGINDVKEIWLSREDWSDRADDVFQFMHMAFQSVERSDDVGIELSVQDGDKRDIIEQVREADKQADWVIKTIHTHHGPGGDRNTEVAPSFLVDFAHECIDAGADAFVCTGPHVIRGIEIYENKPIFYSLGNFAFQVETQKHVPMELFEAAGLEGKDHRPSKVMDHTSPIEAEDGKEAPPRPEGYWWSVLPKCRFTTDGELAEISLLPITLGQDQPRPQRGTPRVASDRMVEQIYAAVRERCAPFGTSVEADGDVFKVHPT